MRRILLVILLGLLSGGIATAQQTTGEKAEAAKNEIMKIESDKVPLHNANGDTTADWDARYNDKDVVNLSKGVFKPEGEILSSIRAGKTYIIDQKQYDHQVRIYNDGTVAVVTYRQDATFREEGKPVIYHNLCVNVWSKFDDGQWKRIAHIVEPAKEPGGAK